MIIGAVDQDAAHAGRAHFCEGDLLAGEGGHALLKRGLIHQANRPIRWALNRAEPLPVDTYSARR
jgi:hypothetical protein